MSFFISNAFAQATTATTTAAPTTAAPPAGSEMFPLLMLVVVIAAFYFMWRRQATQIKQQRELINSLAKGDEVVTSGGMLGKITQVDDDYVTILVANNIEVKFQKSAIVTVLPKGTIK
jgi:preprotein translocase subunit YajC